MTKKLVSFRLPNDLVARLREKADSQDISVTDLVSRFILKGLEDSCIDRDEEKIIQQIRNEILANVNASTKSPFHDLLLRAIASQEKTSSQDHEAYSAEIQELRKQIQDISDKIEKFMLANN